MNSRFPAQAAMQAALRPMHTTRTSGPGVRAFFHARMVGRKRGLRTGLRCF